MTPVRISVVLDASAAVEFSRGSIHVGEVLMLVAEEEAVALLPLACLVEARQWAADRERLQVLVNHPSVVVFPGEPEQWLTLATVYDLVGRQDAAVAALAALDSKAGILTRQPGLYARVDQGSLVILIDD